MAGSGIVHQAWAGRLFALTVEESGSDVDWVVESPVKNSVIRLATAPAKDVIGAKLAAEGVVFTELRKVFADIGKDVIGALIGEL